MDVITGIFEEIIAMLTSGDIFAKLQEVFAGIIEFIGNLF